MGSFIVFSIILSLAVFIIGLGVYQRNTKSTSNITFFALCILASIWTVLFEWTYNIFSSIPTSEGITLLDYLNKSTFLVGIVLIGGVVLFSYYFPVKQKVTPVRFLVAPYATISILTLTEYISGEVVIENSAYVIKVGVLSWLYLVAVVLSVLLLLRNLFKNHNRINRTQRSQNKLLATGFVMSIIVGVLLSVIAPVLYPESMIDSFSPIALLIFLVPVALAIINFKLFDFKVVVARSIAYVFALSTLAALFAMTIFGITSLFFGGDDTPTRIKLTYVVISLFFAFAFQPLKKLFDKVSNSVFYRDAYDPQSLIDGLNTALITNIEIKKLLGECSLIIKQNLKAESCGFIINVGNSESVLITDRRVDITGLEDYFSESAHAIFKGSKVILTDELTGRQSKLASRLRNKKISAFGVLESHDQPVGYMFLGDKKSGNPYSSQDVRTLEIVVDELALGVQNALRFEEISQFNVTLQQKIDEATKELRRANDKLKALDETKDEFISMASHQLRTPLTSVKGYLSMVLDGDTGTIKRDQRKLLQQAYESSQRMVFLIADLLNLSRLKTGKFVIDARPVDLAGIIETEVAQLHETAKLRDLKINFHKPAHFPVLMLDDTKIRQVIMNFLDNAIYYTPHGGEIDVGLKVDGKHVEYTVTDTGLGVPKADQHKLFTKFYRANNAKRMRPDGTGLGLYMAKKVIVSQGGSIIFESTEGKGSTFGFKFPLQSVPTDVKPVTRDISVT